MGKHKRKSTKEAKDTKPNPGKICLGVDLEPNEWIKDSGCSKHMMGNRKLFSTYKAYNGGNVVFGSNLRGNIIGKGQICDNKCKVTFSEHDSEITRNGKVIAHASHKAKNLVSTTRCLELLHMDLFGPSAVRSYGGNRYTLVIVDDYSMYTWTRFLKDKTEAFDQFEIFSKKIQNQLGCTIVSIRTDQGREFDNEVQFGEFCDVNGITHNFSAPRIPQSNGVVERKNRTLQEMSKTMKIEESLNVTFNETPPPAKTSPLVDDDLDEEEAIREIEKKNLENNVKDETQEIDELVNIKESRNHSLENGNMPSKYAEDYKRTQDRITKSFLCLVRSCHGTTSHPRAKALKDRGTRKGRTSTSSTPAFGEPSSSHPTNDDEDVDHNEGTSHASTPSHVSYVNSLTNQVPQVFQNPPNIDPHLEPFYTRQTEIINRQVQIRDEHQCG
ncbi:retrovirus-related pol polyprotein from transposon TNT 1-94 [Tanacetum coccineum]